MIRLFLGLMLLTSTAFADATEVTYTVPVQDPALQPYATFETDSGQIERQGNQVTLTYQLPQELTGTQTSVTMIGVEVPGEVTMDLSGPQANATCTTSSCTIRYKNLNLDESKTRDFLLNKDISRDEFNGRMQVFRHFEGDPIGILHFKPYRPFAYEQNR
jgi:hypothetical protein